MSVANILSRTAVGSIAIILSFFHAPLSGAQPAPAKQFRVILTYPPGGASDIMGRIIAQKLGEIWGQTVLVENRSGANGSIGIDYAAKQPGDGTSFVIGNMGPVAINPLISKVPYDIARDFQPVSLVAIGPTVLVTHPSMPARNLREFVQLARERPGAINFGTAGPGTLGHLGGEMMKRLAKIDIVHVPYKGGVLAIQDLLGGHVQMVFSDPQPIIPHIHAGKAKPLAVTSAKRSPLAPELPTMIEAGLPGFEISAWYVMFAPAGVPKPILNKVSQDIATVLKMPDVIAQMFKVGNIPMPTTPAEFDTIIRNDTELFTKVMAAAGIVPK